MESQMGEQIEEYIKAIITIVNSIKKDKDDIIIHISVDDYDTLLCTNDIEYYLFNSTNQTKTKITEIDEDTLYNIFCFLDANKFNLQTRKTLIEHVEVSDKAWHIEPKQILNSDGEVLGAVAVVVVEKVGDVELRSVVFISPDGTYTNLTMYGSDNEQESKTAFLDLRNIAQWLDRMAFELVGLNE